MEYCKYCGEKRDIIEIGVNECVCSHSANGRHSYTTQSYEAGYAFGEYTLDKIIEIFRYFLIKSKILRS